MEMNKQGTVVIYSRKSRFTGKGESIENQIEMCKQYVALHFGDVPVAVYEDEGFSGGNLERPQFKKMMQDAKSQRFLAIVVYRLDRISRNIGDFAGLIEDLARQKIDFVSIKEQFDTSSPMGRAMMYISSVFSQLERETIAERIRDNMHELSKTGRWLGGTTPTGYVSESATQVTIDGKTKKACHLKLVPQEISLVKMIFHVFLQTESLTKTETYLLQNGYRTKNDNRFTRFALKGILSNPVYLIGDETAYQYMVDQKVDLFAMPGEFDGIHGIMAYNRTLQQPGKAHQTRPMEEWIVSMGKHEGVISGADWVKAQTILLRNRTKGYRRPRSHVALLSGLLRCNQCGDYMRPKMSQRVNGEGEPIYTYLCATKERSHSQCCDMKNANGNLLDSLIVAEMKALSDEKSHFNQSMMQAQKELFGKDGAYAQDLEGVKTQLAENEQAISNLVKTMAKGVDETTEGYILKQLQHMHQEGESLRRRQAELEGLTASHALADLEFALLTETVASFGKTVDTMTVEQKRGMLRTFIQEIVWDGKEAHVVLFGGKGEPLGEDSK